MAAMRMDQGRAFDPRKDNMTTEQAHSVDGLMALVYEYGICVGSHISSCLLGFQPSYHEICHACGRASDAP